MKAVNNQFGAILPKMNGGVDSIVLYSSGARTFGDKKASETNK